NRPAGEGSDQHGRAAAEFRAFGGRLTGLCDRLREARLAVAACKPDAHARPLETLIDIGRILDPADAAALQHRAQCRATRAEQRASDPYAPVVKRGGRHAGEAAVVMGPFVTGLVIPLITDLPHQ